MELEYDFDEMSFPIDGGWGFGSISGKCTVSYDRHGDWMIEDIFVTVSKLIWGQWKHHSYMLDRSKPREFEYYHMLRAIIEKSEREAIEEMVTDALPDEETYEPNYGQAGRTL